MSKAKAIEAYLLDGYSLTGLQALQLFGVYRLSSIINRLRKQGVDIVTDTIYNEQNDCQYAEYYVRDV